MGDFKYAPKAGKFYYYVDTNKIAFDFDEDIEDILENVYGKTLKNGDEISLDVDGNEMSLSHTVSKSESVDIPSTGEGGSTITPVLPGTGEEKKDEEEDIPGVKRDNGLTVTIDDMTVETIKFDDMYATTKLYDGVGKTFNNIQEIIDFIGENITINDNSMLTILEGAEVIFDGYLKDYSNGTLDVIDMNVTYRTSEIPYFAYNKRTGKYYYRDEEFDIDDIVDVFMFKGGYWDAGNGTLKYSIEEIGVTYEKDLVMETDYTIKYRKDGEWKNVFYFDYDGDNDKFIFVNHDNEEYTLDDLREYLDADEGYAVVVMLNEYNLVKSYPGKWRETTLSYYDLEGNEIGPIYCEKIGDLVRQNEDSGTYYDKHILACSQHIFGVQRDLLKSVTIDGYVYKPTPTELYLEYTTYKDSTETLTVYEWMQHYAERYVIVADNNQYIVDRNIKYVVDWYRSNYSDIIVVDTDVFSLYYMDGTLCDSVTMSGTGWVYCKCFYARIEVDYYYKAIFNKNSGLYFNDTTRHFSKEEGISMTIDEINLNDYYEIYDLSGTLIYRNFKGQQCYLWGYQNSSSDFIIESNPYIVKKTFTVTMMTGKQVFYFVLDAKAKGIIYDQSEFKIYLEEQSGKTIDYIKFIYDYKVHTITFEGTDYTVTIN